MLQYKEFEITIKSGTGDDFNKWKHLLPVIPLAFRYRYIITLEAGFDMPTAFDLVMTSQTLMDDGYFQYLDEQLDKIKKRI